MIVHHTNGRQMVTAFATRGRHRPHHQADIHQDFPVWSGRVHTSLRHVKEPLVVMSRGVFAHELAFSVASWRPADAPLPRSIYRRDPGVKRLSPLEGPRGFQGLRAPSPIDPQRLIATSIEGGFNVNEGGRRMALSSQFTGIGLAQLIAREEPAFRAMDGNKIGDSHERECGQDGGGHRNEAQPNC